MVCASCALSDRRQRLTPNYWSLTPMPILCLTAIPVRRQHWMQGAPRDGDAGQPRDGGDGRRLRVQHLLQSSVGRDVSPEMNMSLTRSLIGEQVMDACSDDQRRSQVRTHNDSYTLTHDLTHTSLLRLSFGSVVSGRRTAYSRSVA